MKYAGIIKNDFSAAPGVSLSVFTQGCPHHCSGCHNPETWDFNKGKEFTIETLNEIIKGLKANGIKRTLCIMGGEPLCAENLFLTNLIITSAREEIPGLKVYVWTGYLYKDLKKMIANNGLLQHILSNTDVLIDGPYIEAKRDITDPLRGSRNQRVIYLQHD